MDRCEERYSSLIDRLEYTDFDAAANCAGKNAKFLLIELLNQPVDRRNLSRETGMVEHDLNQIRDCRREIYVAIQPGVNQSNRVVVQAADPAVMRYSVQDRGFYRGAKQVLLAFEE